MPVLAYVTNANKVTVIDTSTNTVVNTIPTTDPDDFAVSVAITPDGRFAYVTNLYCTVSVIDTCENTIVDTINVGIYPMGIAITPNGRYVYVTSSYNDNVSVIDTSTNTVIDTIPVGGDPLGVAIAPDGNFVYVVNAFDDNVSVIDASTNTVVDTIPVGDFPHGIAVTPDGNFAYVSNNEQPPLATTVSVINTSTRTVVDTIPVGFVATYIAVTPDGRFVYVANAGDDNVSVINTATNTVIDTIPVGSYDYGLAITPDGNFVYVTNTGDGNISVIDTATNTVVDTITVGKGPFGITIANIPQCQTPSDRMCIETTRIFDSCMFEEKQQKTFKFPTIIKDQDIQCEITETECSILDIIKIDEQNNLADVKLQIKVFIRFSSDNHEYKKAVCFEKDITLVVPEGADVCCNIDSAVCECIKKINTSCNHRICCTIKLAGVIKSKKLVQIEIPFLNSCETRPCCSDGLQIAPGKSFPLPSEPSHINKIRFAAKTNSGMTSRFTVLLSVIPYTFEVVTGELKPFEINLSGGPYPVQNISLKNLGKSTIYVYGLKTE